MLEIIKNLFKKMSEPLKPRALLIQHIIVSLDFIGM